MGMLCVSLYLRWRLRFLELKHQGSWGQIGHTEAFESQMRLFKRICHWQIGTLAGQSFAAGFAVSHEIHQSAQRHVFLTTWPCFGKSMGAGFV